MRIEISAGGIAAAIPVYDCQLNISSFIGDLDDVVSCFKTVKEETLNLNGGVGNLQSAVDDISYDVSEYTQSVENSRKVKNKTNDFLNLAMRIDADVANLVESNREQFYRVNPWLRPSPPPEEKAWYEQFWGWMCDRATDVVDGIKGVWNWAADSLKKLWDGLVDFYEKNKKIIDTIFIVAGAVMAVAAVVATGGLALVPLLADLGVSVATATMISTGVAVAAAVSTVAAASLNVIDTWLEIDNSFFNIAQKSLNVLSALFNITYSIGGIYNSVTGVSGKEYIARQRAIANGKLGYGNLDAQHPGMRHSSGADFTQSRKQVILEENMRRNGGVLRSDTTGKILEYPVKSASGVSPSQYEAQIDHIFPKSLGGANSFDNAQVIERIANIKKSNILDFNNFNLFSRPDTFNALSFAAWTADDFFVFENIDIGRNLDNCVWASYSK